MAPRRPPAREPSVYDVHVTVGAPASEALLPALLGELLKHLQYSRGQCQAPVDRLEAFYKATVAAAQAEGGKRKRPSSQLRRVGKYLEHLGAQLAALRGLPLGQLALGAAEVALLLGPSPLRPKEVYVVRFSAGPGGGSGESGDAGGGDGSAGVPCAAPSQQQQQQQQPQLPPAPALTPQQAKEVATAAKRLLRGVIVEGGAFEEWADVAAPTKAFVMLRAPAGVAAPPGFLPRRGFSISLRKAFQVNITARLDGAGPWAAPAPADAPAGAPHDQHWRLQQQHGAHARHPTAGAQAGSQQTLEEHLEASMQLCDSDSDDAVAEAAEGQGGGSCGGGEEEAGQGGGDAAWTWFQCVHAVKGMRQAEGGG